MLTGYTGESLKEQVLFMKMQNEQGQQVYFNEVQKNGKVAYIVKALSGQMIPDRDRRPHKTRTFTQLAQAERWLERNGYKGV